MLTGRLERDELIELIHKARKGDRQASQKIVVAFQYFVKGMVARITRHRRGDIFEDLVQEANIGLLAAIEKFDVDRGTSFATYAGFYVREQIFNCLRGLPLVQAGTGKAYWHLVKGERDEEVALACNLTEREVQLVRATLTPPLSVDWSVEEEYLTIPPDAEAKVVRKEALALIQSAIVQLEPRQREILVAYLQGQPLARLAAASGVTRERMRQVKELAVNNLQKKLGVRSSWELIG